VDAVNCGATFDEGIEACKAKYKTFNPRTTGIAIWDEMFGDYDAEIAKEREVAESDAKLDARMEKLAARVIKRLRGEITQGHPEELMKCIDKRIVNAEPLFKALNGGIDEYEAFVKSKGITDATYEMRRDWAWLRENMAAATKEFEQENP
jgi:hypothetical protein